MRIARYTGTIATAIAIGLGGGGTPLPPPTNCDSPWQSAFASPGLCGFPDPAYNNVGVPPGTTLTPLTGDITYSTPGQTITGVQITGHVSITATNVTIKNSKIIGNGTVAHPDGAGNEIVDVCACVVTFQDVEITTAPGNGYEFSIHGPTGGAGGDVQTLTRVWGHGNVDMTDWTEGQMTIQDSYSIIGQPDGSGGWEPAIPGDHIENFYINEATIIANHNTIFDPAPQTSVIFGNTNNGIDPGTPCTNHLTITNNLLAGGGQNLTYCAHSTAVGTATATTTGNRFARCGGGVEVPGGDGTWLCPALFDHPGSNDGFGYYPRVGSFSLVTSYYTASFSWSGNVLDEDGSTIAEP